MVERTLEWKVIEVTARKLGVGEKALEKWRERRSVPHKWRIAIIRASEGLVSIDDFDHGNGRA